MERIDDLLFHGLHIIQDDETCCFTADAVLLTSFFRLKPSDRVIDLGCGSGILSILGEGKTGASFTGIDRQASLVSMGNRSAAMNGQRITFWEMDVADAPAHFGHGSFSTAVMNPPYFHSGDASKNASRALARHADTFDAAENFLHAAFLLLKNGGKLFLCYPASHLTDMLCALRQFRLEPKRIGLVAASVSKAPYLALIEAKKLASPGVQMECVQFLQSET